MPDSEPAPASEFDGRPIVGGRRVDGVTPMPVIDPYRGETMAVVQGAGPQQVEQAIIAARAAQPEVAALPVHARADLLRAVAALVAERADDIAATVTRQTGKALKDTRREMSRSRSTLRAIATAIEAETGEVVAADAIPGGEGLTAFVRREPLGVVAAIVPFNAPFNLAMHKVAAAIGAGNSVIVKPSDYAPLSGYQLAEVFLAAGAPPGAVSVLPGPEVGQALVAAPGVDAVSFTGGVPAGRAITRDAGLKRLILELGGNSPNIVHADADVEAAVSALVAGGFSNTGQSCNSVQRILVHESINEDLTTRLADATGRLVLGDPLDPATDVGTLVTEDAARRVESWVDEAVADGAQVAAGGKREGAAYRPTVLTRVRPDMRICAEEIFGPVVCVVTYADLDDAIDLANGTPFGLQAAVFTRSLAVAFDVSSRLRAGGVMVNRSSNTRLDHLPFGGLGDSGHGREGGRYSIEEMTRRKLTIIDAAALGTAR